MIPARSLCWLLAPGAGAPSSSAWMQSFQRRLEPLGRVQCLDYPYQLAGRRTPDRHAVLVQAHRDALESAQSSGARHVVLIGKSMGGRIGCHVAVLALRKPSALICLGYPLIGQNGAVRDQVLYELTQPILFVQGSRDPMCPLEHLDSVRGKLRAPNELYVVDDGDHSLVVKKATLKSSGLTQAEIDERIIERIQAFLERQLRALAP